MFSKSWWKSVMTFRYMLLPSLINVLFWLGLVICLLTVVVDWSQGMFWQGVATLIIAPLLLRLACEVLIILFQINNTLFDLWRNERTVSSENK